MLLVGMAEPQTYDGKCSKCGAGQPRKYRSKPQLARYEADQVAGRILCQPCRSARMWAEKGDKLREEMSERAKENWRDPEKRAAWMAGRPEETEETRVARSDRAKARWQDPDYARRVAESNRATQGTAEARAAMSKAVRAGMTRDVRRKISERRSAEEGARVPAPRKPWRQNAEKRRAYMKGLRARNPGREAARGISKWERLRGAVVAKYGGKCADCGRTEMACLTMDHVNDDGDAERAEVGGSWKIYRKWRDDPLRDDLAVRCWTCHARRHRTAVGQAPATRSRRALRASVIAGYGGKCAECSEDDPVVMDLDHVGGVGGGKDREDAWKTYKRARDLGFPPEYRILCANCNALDSARRLAQASSGRAYDPGAPMPEVCHQRTVRDAREAGDRERYPNLFGRPIGDFALSHEPFTDEVREFIRTYEWMGDVGNSPRWTFGARVDGVLAGVVCLGEPLTYSRMWDLPRERIREVEAQVHRGACASFAHPHLASRLISFAVRWMVANTTKRAFFAYADPLAGEVGTVYQAANFDYLGHRWGTARAYSHPGWRGGRPFGSKSLGRTGTLRWFVRNVMGREFDRAWLGASGYKDMEKVPADVRDAWAAWRRDILRTAASWRLPSKGKYVRIGGPGKLQARAARRAFTGKVEPYPKRCT